MYESIKIFMRYQVTGTCIYRMVYLGLRTVENYRKFTAKVHCHICSYTVSKYVTNSSY